MEKGHRLSRLGDHWRVIYRVVADELGCFKLFNYRPTTIGGPGISDYRPAKKRARDRHSSVSRSEFFAVSSRR